MTLEGHVPPDREPYLPYSARSGWELLARLEPFGLKVRGYDLIPEGAVIERCLQFMINQAKNPPEWKGSI